MGLYTHIQAIPENCELLIRARQDMEIAIQMPFFQSFAEETVYVNKNSSEQVYVANAVKELIRVHPDLEKRHFKTKGTCDAVVYLLSPTRRKGNYNDQSLIYKAITGSEPLHPRAYTPQGFSIGFVPASQVSIIASYLDHITIDQLHEHYDPPKMIELYVNGIYADATEMYPDGDEGQFHIVWEELVDIRDLYRAAANHNEATFVVID